jgi:hypothetical protein
MLYYSYRMKKRDTIKWQEDNIDLLLLIRARARAKEKGVPFAIERSDVVIPSCCPVLGCPIVVRRGKGRRKDAPSLDRIIPEKGYVKGNVWIISDLANRMKQEASIEELKAFASWINKL